MTATRDWLFSGDPTVVQRDYLWIDPLLIMPEIGLDPQDPVHVIRAQQIVAEASQMLDEFTGHRYGPERCIAATYRVRGLPYLNLTPAAGAIAFVVVHDDDCLPSEDSYTTATGLRCLGTETSDWCLEAPGQIRLDRASPTRFIGELPTTCRPQNSLVTVAYRSRANWPPGMMAALWTLIKNLGAEPNACQMPAGTTSVNRQGVSWSIDPDAATAMTGISSVDAWIKRNRPSLRMSDPTHASLLYQRSVECSTLGLPGAGVDTRPPVVDITHYAGSDLEVRANVRHMSTVGAVWLAQVRRNRLAGTPVDTTFVVTPDAIGALLTIPAAEVDRLVADYGVDLTEAGLPVRRYTGVYDVQITLPDQQPNTLFQGILQIDADVSRA